MARFEANSDILLQIDEQARQQILGMSEELLEECFGEGALVPNEMDVGPLDVCMDIATSEYLTDRCQRPISREHEGQIATLFSRDGEVRMRARESQARILIGTVGNAFPPSIWNCCKSGCFSNIAMDPDQSHVLEVVMNIHQEACVLYDNKRRDGLIEARRRSEAGSTMVHSTPMRVARDRLERISDPGGTDRWTAIQLHRDFCVKHLPFLRGLKATSEGVMIANGFCVVAQGLILHACMQTLYHRRTSENRRSDTRWPSLLDESGVRERQHRRNGLRTNFPSINNLPRFECGCEDRCFADVAPPYLQKLWDEFSRLATGGNAQSDETAFLLDKLCNACSNSVVRTCSRALANIFCVSEALIRDIKMVLQEMCNDPRLLNEPLRQRPSPRYAAGHPANRLPENIVKRIENEIEYICRADPDATDGGVARRPNDPEVNSRERLRRALLKCATESEGDSRVPSAATMDRIIDQYLHERGMRLTFVQSDHNACPFCKKEKYLLLALDVEIKAKQRQIQQNDLSTTQRQELVEDLRRLCSEEEAVLSELSAHIRRDAALRGWLKKLFDVLRNRHNIFLNDHRGVPAENVPHSWRSRKGLGTVTHQDDMSKVDLPSSVVEASCDITRFRFNVNAHVDGVTKNATVFSHEQGTGSRNASSVIENVLMELLLTCKGEEIKILVSDCAAVGKNWLTSVAFPQYLVDQGLVSIAMVVFLENNHGKFFADMLFGQFQRLSRRVTILGIDDLLSTFESIQSRRGGHVSGYALNPLSSIEFSEVLKHLGYSVQLDPPFGFTRRNTHISAACTQEARHRITKECPDLDALIGTLLPEEEGMVRLSSEHLNEKSIYELPFNLRPIDVPAATMNTVPETVSPISAARQPLVFPYRKVFAERGMGLVSQKAAKKVGYNGLFFRGQDAFPELSSNSSRLVAQAWPPGLIDESISENARNVENRKSAPDNWVVRLPVCHYGNDGTGFKARYLPRNFLNALAPQGPRDASPWIPTPTYRELPFPLIPHTSAFKAMLSFSNMNQTPDMSFSTLVPLSFVYHMMLDRAGVTDPFGQKRAARVSRQSYTAYLRQKSLPITQRPGARAHTPEDR